MFGVTAYEGGDLFNDANGTEWVKEWGVEVVGIPLSIGGYNLPEPPLANGSKAACPGPKNITEAELRNWWDLDTGKAAARFFRGLWPSSIYPWGRWLPNIAAGAAEPFVYLLDNTWGNGECNTCSGGPPANATLWGIANGLALRMARQAAPGIRRAHIGNEPNAGWFNKVPINDDGAFAAFFRDASLGIKSVVGPVQIGGPVLCWGPLDGYGGMAQFSWFSKIMDATLHTARSPQQPAGVNALDFVDFHAYSNCEENANRIVSEIHMIAAYAATQHNVHMPSAITETSVDMVGLGNWSNHSYHFTHRTLPRIRQMMALLEHPDKMLTVQEHDLGAWAGGRYKFNGCGTGNLTTGCATPEMEMYRAFKPLRGFRLERAVSGVDDATMDVKFETSLNTDQGTFGAIVIAAANFGANTTAFVVELEPEWAAFVDSDLEPWSSVILDSKSLRAFPAPKPSSTQGTVIGTMALPRMSLVVLTLPLTARHVPSTVHTSTEVFAPDVGVVIDNTSEVSSRIIGGGKRRAIVNTTVLIPDDLHGTSSPRLRFGVKGPAVGCDKWSVTLDDGAYKLDWTATQEFRGGGCRANPENTAAFNCSQVLEQGHGIGFAEIVLHGYTPPAPAPTAACDISEPGAVWGGTQIPIDPWGVGVTVGEAHGGECFRLL
eukprot:COSAG06_NODE_5013_length_3791_cov_1.192308_2_plen_660_part_00